MVVDRARPDHHHEPVVLAVQDAGDGGAAAFDQRLRRVGRRQPSCSSAGVISGRTALMRVSSMRVVSWVEIGLAERCAWVMAGPIVARRPCAALQRARACSALCLRRAARVIVTSSGPGRCRVCTPDSRWPSSTNPFDSTPSR